MNNREQKLHREIGEMKERMKTLSASIAKDQSELGLFVQELGDDFDRRIVKLGTALTSVEHVQKRDGKDIQQLIERIEKLEKGVNNLAWGKAQHEDLVKLDDRVGKIEDCIDWEAARATMNGVVDLPPNAKRIMEEDKETLRSLADSDFHETPKQRWMRENLRPGEVYAGIILAKYEDKYDYHLAASISGNRVGLAYPTAREKDLMRVNLGNSLPYVRRIPVE